VLAQLLHSAEDLGENSDARVAFHRGSKCSGSET
jgi:hypothetical protein